MSKTVTFDLEADGVPYNADAVVLSDPTGAFGVKRTDNNAIVIVNNTAMINQGVGQYAYTFTEPIEGLTYEAWVKWTHFGVSNWLKKIIVDSDDPTEIVDGRYATYAGMKSRFGAENIDRWAEVSGDSVDPGVKFAAISSAIAESDDQVDDILRNGAYSVPFSAPVPSIIKRCADQLAAVILYEAKGVIDVNSEGEPQHRLWFQRRDALSTLDRIRRGILKLNGLTPVSAFPTSD